MKVVSVQKVCLTYYERMKVRVHRIYTTTSPIYYECECLEDLCHHYYDVCSMYNVYIYTDTYIYTYITSGVMPVRREREYVCMCVRI